MIGKELARVGILAHLGFRFFGLAYTGATLFADGCGEKRDAGLSFLGEELIAAVNETPMILDLLPRRPPRSRRGGAARPRAGLHPFQRLAPCAQRPPTPRTRPCAPSLRKAA